MPSVQQTAALRGLRPVAKALGAWVGEMYRRGIGWRAAVESSRTMRYELRRLELADRAGAHRAQRELVAVPVRVRVGAQGDDDGDDQAPSGRRGCR